MINRTFTLIINIVGGATTRPKRTDASCTTIDKTYKPTVGHIRGNLLAQWDAVTNSDIHRCSPNSKWIIERLDPSYEDGGVYPDEIKK